MPILLALIGAAITAYVWMNRAKRGAEIANDLIGVAAELKNAPRKYGFRRRANQHPVDGIDEPDLALGGLAVAFLEMDDLPTTEARAQMDVSLRKHLHLDAEKAQEVTVMGRWFVEECHGPVQAFPRLAKRLYKIDDAAHFNDLMAVLTDITQSSAGGPSPRQSDALSDLARIFRLK
ncbi:MAG: hypothetical protein WA790_00685 [Sulfitobacter sp.]